MVLLVIEPSKDGDHDQLKIPTKTCVTLKKVKRRFSFLELFCKIYFNCDKYISKANI